MLAGAVVVRNPSSGEWPSNAERKASISRCKSPVPTRGQDAGHDGRVALLETRQALVDVGDEVPVLGELAFVDEVDAGVALLCDDLPHRGAQVVIGCGALRQLRRNGQGADVCGECATGATSHYFLVGSAAGFAVLAGSFSPASTAFLIGLIVRRYAKIALRSSPVMFW